MSDQSPLQIADRSRFAAASTNFWDRRQIRFDNVEIDSRRQCREARPIELDPGANTGGGPRLSTAENVHDLRAYVLRVGVLVLILSLFVSAVTVAVIGRSVLESGLFDATPALLVLVAVSLLAEGGTRERLRDAMLGLDKHPDATGIARLLALA